MTPDRFTKATEHSSSSPTSVPRSVAHRMRVLVVDDDGETRTLLCQVLTDLGYMARPATSGSEALALHHAEPADIIISDWQMPDIDGMELCRRARQLHASGHASDRYTYFILTTSFAEHDVFVEGMHAGVDDYAPKPLDLVELEARLHAAARVVLAYRELASANTALRRESWRSYRAARVDALTQVPNRQSMIEAFVDILARARRYGHRFSLAVCSVDDFKQYEDTYGHIAGVVALRRIALAIRARLRTGDGCYRFGGEELVLVLPEQQLSTALRVVDRVRAHVEGLGIGLDEGRVLTLSAGLAELDVTFDATVDSCLSRADRALLRAKAGGRNSVEAEEVTDETPV